MTIRLSLGAIVLLSGVSIARVSQAQEAGFGVKAPESPGFAPPLEARANDGHATGLMVQARVQSQSGLLSLAGGGTGFLVGYQGSAFSLGLGLGLSRIGVNSGGESAALTLFQVAPAAIIDVWRSKDGRARANVVASAGIARASLDATVTSSECDESGACRNSTKDGSASAILIPVSLGFGGDYFLSRNFALGAEFGLQALFLASASTSSAGNSASVDAGGNAQFAYGALRATFVVGD
ncbi:MAG TPA: hypothetical protein VER12_09450 [Polyangiaceae bacterium]|nr:hypothetical protein [Polyangiaceae bacterium]